MGPVLRYLRACGRDIQLRPDQGACHVSFHASVSAAEVGERLGRVSGWLTRAARMTEGLLLRGSSQLLSALREDAAVRTVRSAFVDPLGLPYVLTDRLFVRFQAEVPATDAARQLEQWGLSVERPGGVQQSWLVRVPDQSPDAPLDWANRLGREPGVQYAEPDAIRAIRFACDTVAPPSLSDLHWHLRDIGVQDAWQKTRGAGMRVAVLDSGVATTHPSLATRLLPGRDFDNEDSDPRPYVPFPASPKQLIQACHGTACAGVVGAAFGGPNAAFGVAPECQLVPVRLTQPRQTDLYRDVLAWLRGRADVLLCAWGTTPSDELAEMIRDLADDGPHGRGMVVVASAGNDAATPLWYPAGLPSVVAVGAVIDLSGRRADYSNFGDGLDLVAPSNGGSKGITTTDLPGFQGLTPGDFRRATQTSVAFGGTSAAAAIVAGVAALVRSANPHLSASKVAELLRKTAERLPDVQFHGEAYAQRYGAGRVHAGRAVAEAVQAVEPPPI